MQTLAVVNNKGGVGKTTTATNLGAALVQSGHRVLLVDLDSQASLSLGLGLRRDELSPSTAEILIERRDAFAVIRPTGVPGLDILPGSMELSSVDLLLSTAHGRENRLRDALAPIASRYDTILLDCPPSISLVSLNALVAADGVIVPVIPHYMAMEGLVNLMESLRLARDGIGVQAKLTGILLTLADSRTRATQEIMSLIRGAYGDAVFETVIRTNVRLQEAPSHGKTIFEYDREATGAIGYQALASEVLQRMERDDAHREAGHGALEGFVRSAKLAPHQHVRPRPVHSYGRS